VDTRPGGDKNGPIVFINASSEIIPTGCEASILFHWEADPASNPPYGAIVNIDVTGPVVGGTWPYPLTKDGIDLRLTPTITPGDHTWRAKISDIASAPLRDVQADPLKVSFSGQC
jgi:hypothetical protein